MLTVDGENAVVMANDAQMVFLFRENGKIDLYQTQYVAENGELVTPPDDTGDTPTPTPSTGGSSSSGTTSKSTSSKS